MLVFQGWVQLVGGVKQCVFQEGYSINVYTHLSQICTPLNFEERPLNIVTAPSEVFLKYIIPSAGPAGKTNEVAITGTVPLDHNY